jgi:hypothetical protein
MIRLCLPVELVPGWNAHDSLLPTEDPPSITVDGSTSRRSLASTTVTHLPSRPSVFYSGNCAGPFNYRILDSFFDCDTSPQSCRASEACVGLKLELLIPLNPYQLGQ